MKYVYLLVSWLGTQPHTTSDVVIHDVVAVFETPEACNDQRQLLIEILDDDKRSFVCVEYRIRR